MEIRMPYKQTKRPLLIMLFALCAIGAKAQFFFGFPQQQPMQQQREKYTAPSYKGGEKSMKAFITKNYHQPSSRQLVDGRIVVAVIVSPKGKVQETHIVRSVSDALDAEALRVCRKMAFKPATLGKKKVKGRIDVVFPVKHGRVTFLDLPTIEV